MGVCDIPAISTVCDVAGEASASLIAAPFDWLAAAMGGAAAWMFESVWSLFDATTRVELTSPEYLAVYNLIFGIAIWLMLILFCLQLLGGLVRRDPKALSTAVVGLAKSVLGSFVVVTVTAGLLEITDQLAVGIVQAAGTTMEQMGERIATLLLTLTTLTVAAPGAGVIITIFLAGLAISAAGLVWFTLLIRSALLLVAVVMAPIALSGFTWTATKGWFGKWASFVLALIVSKLVMVVIFLVATAQTSTPIDFDLGSVADPITGIVLMFMASFAPYMSYKFINFAGFDMYHSMSAEQEVKSALSRPLPPRPTPQMGTARKVLGGKPTGGGPSSRPGGAGPVPTAKGSGFSGGTGGGAGAGLGVAAGATVVAAKAGPKIGKALGRAGGQQIHSGQQTARGSSADSTPRQPDDPAAKPSAPPPRPSPRKPSGPAGTGS